MEILQATKNSYWQQHNNVMNHKHCFSSSIALFSSAKSAVFIKPLGMIIYFHRHFFLLDSFLFLLAMTSIHPLHSLRYYYYYCRELLHQFFFFFSLRTISHVLMLFCFYEFLTVLRSFVRVNKYGAEFLPRIIF